MMKKRSLKSNKDKSVVGSSNSPFDEYELLDVNHDEAPHAHVPSLDACSSSVGATRKGGILF